MISSAVSSASSAPRQLQETRPAQNTQKATPPPAATQVQKAQQATAHPQAAQAPRSEAPRSVTNVQGQKTGRIVNTTA